jgi:acetyl esterase/lipase
MNNMRTLFLALFIILFNQTKAQDQRQQLVDNLISKLTVKKDIRYNQSGRPLLLDIYYPPSYRGERLPCVVWIHGGGLTNPKLTKDYDIVRWGAARTALDGFISVSVDYRLVTEDPLPAAIEDCSTAIRFLKANADKFHINPFRIGVVGESSGGFLSAFMIFSGDTDKFPTNDWKDYSDKVACGVVWYGYTKHPNTTYDVLDYITPDDPPVLLIHGQKDNVVPLQNSNNIEKKCKENKLDVSLKVIKNADHGFFDVNKKFEDYKKHTEEALQLTIDFFKKHLRGGA